jgi:hypothetical protein
VTTTSADSASTDRGAGLERAALVIAAIGIAVATLLALASILISIPSHVSLNYNEGWNAYHVVHLQRGWPLYPVAGWFPNTYPPLSFYLVAWASAARDPIVVGREISIAAFAAWTGALVPMARRLGAAHRDAWTAAALFAVTMTLYTQYVGIDDPELLGHAVQALGLTLLLKDATNARRAALAAAACASALFVKQTLVVAPAACAIWLSTVDRRSAWWFVVMFAAAAAVGGAASIAAFGPVFIVDLLAPRAYVPLRALGKTALWTARLAAPIAIALVMSRRSSRDAGVRFCTIYAAIAALAGAILSGGDGINANVWFDAIAALSLMSALALTASRRSPAVRDRAHTRLMLALAVAPLVAAILPSARVWQPANGWFGTRGNRDAAAADVAFLTQHDGRALCEELALCFWAGKRVEADIFHVREQMLLGLPAAAELARLVDARTFSVIQLNVDGRALGDEFTHALERGYTVARTAAGRRLYVPR